jgi:hypothetical protein
MEEVVPYGLSLAVGVPCSFDLIRGCPDSPRKAVGAGQSGLESRFASLRYAPFWVLQRGL